MSDLKEGEVIANKKGNHYRFVSVEDSQEEAEKLCEQLADAGFQPATFPRTDNKKIEVFVKFSKAEECQWLIEKEFCDKCPPEKKADCHPNSCKIKGELEDILWHEQMGFHRVLEYKLKKLKGEVLPKQEEGIAS